MGKKKCKKRKLIKGFSLEEQTEMALKARKASHRRMTLGLDLSTRKKDTHPKYSRKGRNKNQD
jgi:ribosomal protein L13E